MSTLSAERLGVLHDDLLVSNRNIRFIIDYCAKHGISETSILSGLGYPESYLKDPDQWVPLDIFNTIAKRSRKAFYDDPGVFYRIGIAATQDGGLGVLESLKKTLARATMRPGFFIQKIPQYNLFFNKTKTFKVISLERNSALLQVRFHNHIDPLYDFNSGQLIVGIIASFPQMWGLPLGTVEEGMLPYDIVRLLQQEFSLFAELRDGRLFIEGEEYGHEVLLRETSLGNESHHLGDYREADMTSGPNDRRAMLITKELAYNNYRRQAERRIDYKILIPGQIYNAPHFILKASWENPSLPHYLKLAANLVLPRKKDQLKELEERALSLQAYARKLEEKISERNRIILDEKQKMTELQQRVNGIVHSQLPPDLVDAMVAGKMDLKKRYGVVMFTDLVGFSTKVNETENFQDLLEELNRYFEVVHASIKARGGWVYKYMGDGTMSVFGGYQDEPDYQELGLNALRAAEKIRTLINGMGWGIRIGIEYGDFVAGEIGPPGERIWDFLGSTVNFACRLEQHTNKDEILLGPQLVTLLGEKISAQERSITLKGIGQQHVYSYNHIRI